MMCASRGGNGLAPPTFPYFAEFIEGRRGEILDAALAVFGEKGYEAGTMRAIAKRVGVSEPALYRHYESKEAILADIVATAGDRITGELRASLEAVSGENVIPMLHALIQLRRRTFARKSAEIAAESGGAAATDSHAPSSIQTDAGAVLHVLFHAAPHNEIFIGLLRAHLGRPLVEAVRATIPRVDAHFGIDRTPEDLSAKLRVFMSLFAGYFTTSLVFDAPPNDKAIVEAMLTIMGWDTE